MPIESERLIHDNAPTTEQLRRLASVGVKSAVTRERFKTLRRSKGVHYFVDELDLLIDATQRDEPAQVRHRMAVRIGVRPPSQDTPKVWSLKYFDTYSVEPEPGVWRAERSTYRFEWTRNQILMADRALRLVGFNTPHDEDLDYYLDHFSIDDDSAAILEVEDDIRMVTADDCEELIKDTSEYFRVVDAVESSYRS